MNRSPGILTPMKTPSDDRSPESPEDEQEETFATRTREEMSDAKSGNKFVRVLTVMAYVLCVSMAAILLSLYYVLVWDPPKHIDDDVDSPSALKAERQRLEVDYDLFNDPFWIQNYSHNQLNEIEEPTPIPLLQDIVFTTPNTTSFNYFENDKMEIEVPEYDDSFTIVNDSFVEKENVYASNNFTEDGSGILRRLKSMYDK